MKELEKIMADLDAEITKAKADLAHARAVQALKGHRKFLASGGCHTCRGSGCVPRCYRVQTGEFTSHQETELIQCPDCAGGKPGDVTSPLSPAARSFSAKKIREASGRDVCLAVSRESVQAVPEIKEKTEHETLKIQERNDLKEAGKIRRGSRVRVTNKRSRKVPYGTEGEIFWVSPEEDRIGFRDTEGETCWTAVSNVSVLLPEDWRSDSLSRKATEQVAAYIFKGDQIGEEVVEWAGVTKRGSWAARTDRGHWVNAPKALAGWDSVRFGPLAGVLVEALRIYLEGLALGEAEALADVGDFADGFPELADTFDRVGFFGRFRGRE